MIGVDPMTDDNNPEGLWGQLKDAFVGRKMARAERGHLLTGEADVDHKKRLPPGQRQVENCPCLTLAFNLPLISRNGRST